jgi:hypothetical protein
VRLVHALPFLAGAFAFGWIDGMLWGISQLLTAGLCSGLVKVGMTISWFKEWRRGY